MGQHAVWGKKEGQKIHVDLTMTQVFAKIGMILDTVFSVTAAYTCMTEATTRPDGSYKKTTKKPKDSDGNE